MIVGLYPRVSTQEQAKDGYSIGEQTERLKKYCEAMGWTVYKTYTDAGYSGGNTDRPALQEMIRDVKASSYSHITSLSIISPQNLLYVNHPFPKSYHR